MTMINTNNSKEYYIPSFILFIKYRNGWIIYNTITNAILYVDEELYNKLIKSRKINIDKNEKYKQYIEELIENDILIPTYLNEKFLLNYLINKVKFNYKSHTFTILPTYNCNLACPYCYQDKRIKESMSKEVANSLIKWIKNRIEKYNVKDLHLTFYGGEPLLRVDLIEYISSILKDYCQAHEISFFSRLMYLID